MVCVKSIVDGRCAGCHRIGAIAPFWAKPALELSRFAVPQVVALEFPRR